MVAETEEDRMNTEEHRQLRHEAAQEICCGECGYHRNGAHHPGIKCPRTGRCGECGNTWPCADHGFYCTTFCNCAHALHDGVPINHACFVLPPTMLAAERAGDFEAAGRILAAYKKRKTHRGRKEEV